MPSRLTVLKPGSVKVTLYMPGLRLTIRYWPVAVGRRRADLLDQRRAGGFDRDAGHDRADVVSHDAGDGLGAGGRRRQ